MTRTIIIGDIHGCYVELLALLDRAAVTSDDLVVSVGDLVDRGPEPAEVVRWFRGRPGSVVLMGNHERKHVRGIYSYSQEVTRAQIGASYADDVAWMTTLPYYYETPEIRVVHAALIPGRPLAEQPEDILCGSTSGEAKLKKLVPDGWWHEHYDEAVPVVFGHHVTGAEPLVREGKIYGIDTGACHGLRLTALSVPDFTLYSVPARADHWETVAHTFQVPVLRTRPWSTMSWAKLEAAVAEHRDDAAPETASYLRAIAAWADAIRALVPTFVARVAELAGTLDAAATEAHPAKRLLFMYRRGRLDLAAVEARCGTPALTLALAANLGLDVSTLPPEP